MPLNQVHINELITLYTTGRLQDCLGRATALSGQYPDDPFIWNFLGIAHAALGNPQDSIKHCSRALELNPAYAEAHQNIGNALASMGKHEEAIDSYNRALQIKPDMVKALNSMGPALAAMEKYEEAIDSYNRALKIKPDYPEALNNLGITLMEMGRHPEAIENFRKALQLKPNQPETLNNLGTALKAFGLIDDAKSSYQQALQFKPDYIACHANLGALKKHESGDPQIAQMQNLYRNIARSNPGRAELGFALAKAHEDIGDFDEAFRLYVENNRLRKEELGYSIEQDRALFRQIQSVFGASSPVLHADEVAPGPHRPVFIVGMPRSGTSLVEQILASHPQVFGAGELETMRQATQPLVEQLQNIGPLDKTALSRLRRQYLHEFERLKTVRPVITDKMPVNFRWLGFILAAFPEAKVINLNRDPVATCWSIFKHYFPARGLGFAWDLADLAEYFGLYRHLMAFWHERFPGRIYELDYERLTENQEAETRRLLEYCDLEWHDDCLNFHRTNRAVSTASSTQVRQKLYTGSSQAWRKYEKHLAPLIQDLACKER